MSAPLVTRMVEDYLSLIWKAYEWPGGEASTSDIAQRLGVTPSTVSANLKRLARDGFIFYAPYGSITLTDSGRRIAVGVVRRHRIIETYLVQRLGLGWDEVHLEAEQMEHSVSERVLEAMALALGSPTADPHGDPIPDADGNVEVGKSVTLRELVQSSDLPHEATVIRVSDRSPDLLRFLDESQIMVGAVLGLVNFSPASGVVTVTISGSAANISLGMDAAEAIRVAVP